MRKVWNTWFIVMGILFAMSQFKNYGIGIGFAIGGLIGSFLVGGLFGWVIYGLYRGIKIWWREFVKNGR